MNKKHSGYIFVPLTKSDRTRNKMLYALAKKVKKLSKGKCMLLKAVRLK